MSVHIYALMRDGRVVYIGRSSDVASRVPKHSNKDFDRTKILEICTRETAAEREEHYIKLYKPEYNKATSGGIGQYAKVGLVKVRRINMSIPPGLHDLAKALAKRVHYTNFSGLVVKLIYQELELQKKAGVR